MKISTFCQRLCAFVLIMVLCVASTMAAPPSYFNDYSEIKQLDSKRQPATACDRDNALSLICYQCATTHIEQFRAFHSNCCSSDTDTGMQFRSYCTKIYREPPKRGGLWA